MSDPFTNLPLPLDSTKQTMAQEAEGGQTLELVKPEFANPSHEIKADTLKRSFL